MSPSLGELGGVVVVLVTAAPTVRASSLAKASLIVMVLPACASLSWGNSALGVGILLYCGYPWVSWSDVN